MPIRYDQLLALKIPDVVQDYTAKDCILYALALGFGQDPVNEDELAFITGKHPKVAQYVQSFPQTGEFVTKTADLLRFLLPHYIKEGKSYLTVAFGCTGGQHRSVFIAEEIKRLLENDGWVSSVGRLDVVNVNLLQ